MRSIDSVASSGSLTLPLRFRAARSSQSVSRLTAAARLRPESVQEAGAHREPDQKQKWKASRHDIPRVPNQFPWKSEMERESARAVQTTR